MDDEVGCKDGDAVRADAREEDDEGRGGTGVEKVLIRGGRGKCRRASAEK